MNIIWSKEELNKIKRIILLRTNLKLDEENNLVHSNSDRFNVDGSIGLHDAIVSDIEKLIYHQNKEDIARVLNKASQVKADPTNHNHFGLIMTLSRINPQDYTQIFVILKEISSHYKKTINTIATNTLKNCENIEEMKEKFDYIKNSTEETEEEKSIKEIIFNTFKDTNGVCEDELFKGLINKLNNNIKNILQEDLLIKISSYNKNKEKLLNRIFSIPNPVFAKIENENLKSQRKRY